MVLVRRENGGMYGGGQKGEWWGYGPAQKEKVGVCRGSNKGEWWDVWRW